MNIKGLERLAAYLRTINWEGIEDLVFIQPSLDEEEIEYDEV